MPITYIRRDLYDEIINLGDEPSAFIDKTVEEALKLRRGKIKNKKTSVKRNESKIKNKKTSVKRNESP